MNVKSINIVPSQNSLGEKDISKGSLVGATASALFDRYILKGALIGYWWQKEQDKVLFLIKIVLIDYQYQEMIYALKASRTGVKTIK